MKLRKLMFLPLLAIALNSCSGDDSSDPIYQPPATQYPMTAKINGELFQMANPFGSDFATSTISSDYPNEEFIQMQGRPNLSFMTEINIWIDRDDLHPGTYQVGPETDGFATHIDLIDNTGTTSDLTKSGHITITEVNTTLKTVKGTFEFETMDYGVPETTIHHVTEGTFNYRYDVVD